MLLELLEKFEDLFQPASPDEVESRIPKNAVVMTVNLYYDYDECEYLPRHQLKNRIPAYISVPVGTIMVPESSEMICKGDEGDFISLDGAITATLEFDWYKPYRTRKDK